MDDFNTMDAWDKESLGLKVGDKVRLTGPGWGGNRDRVVPVDTVTSGGLARSEEDGIDSLTGPDGKPYGQTYAIEVVERVSDGHIALDDVSAGDKVRISFAVDVSYVGDIHRGREISYEGLDGRDYAVVLSPENLEELTIVRLGKTVPDAEGVMASGTDHAMAAIEYAIEKGWRP